VDLFPKEYIEPQAREIFQRLPSLIKGYLRTGALIGNGAYIDRQFNTIDVCVVTPVHALSEKYLKHYKKDVEVSPKKAVAMPEKIES
jgi:putative hemolysin